MTRRRRLGVIGTLVWDVIYGRPPMRSPVEEWGGIAYSLGALDAAVSNDWEIVPLIRTGSDRIVAAREFLRTLSHVAPTASLIEVPYPNNRVALTYYSSERRSEVLTGGIPPWNWLGLKPLLREIDALYVNMISGFEFDLEVAQLLRQNFKGPIYCDLHSLFLGVRADGLRTPQPLPDAALWCRCFDMVQMNESEMSLIGPDPLQIASAALSSGVRLMVVTMGSRGVVYFTDSHFHDVNSLSESRSFSSHGAIRTALLPAAISRADASSDPTGCGDVWGATYFARLLAGDSFACAMDAAMRAAARNVEHRGATGLSDYLRGGIAIK